uniref:Uncharacterized protein n=1 Tax=Oryza glumipatula TaxID=40148 RepID=A0A0D9Z7Z9_9ORYZ
MAISPASMLRGRTRAMERRIPKRDAWFAFAFGFSTSSLLPFLSGSFAAAEGGGETKAAAAAAAARRTRNERGKQKAIAAKKRTKRSRPGSTVRQ